MKIMVVLAAGMALLVCFLPTTTANGAADEDPKHLRRLQPGGDRRTYIVTFADTRGNRNQKAQAVSNAVGGSVRRVYQKVLNGFAIDLPERAAENLARNPNVASIEEDQQAFPSSWGLDRIDQCALPLSDTATKIDANGLRVYIIDTGVLGSHEEFSGVIGPSTCHRNFHDSNAVLTDRVGHGTHVASTACGSVYGVAENCELCAVQVLGRNGGSFSDVIAGIDFAADNCESPPCVINMSLGGGRSDRVNESVDNAFALGVISVVAAGNESTDACNTTPASAATAITVGSTTDRDDPSGFTNFGDCVDIYAPGSDITAAYIGSDSATRSLSGTSMASPHVAGIVAAMLAADEGSDVRARLAATSTVLNVDTRTPDVGIATIGLDCGNDPNPPPPPPPPPPSAEPSPSPPSPPPSAEPSPSPPPPTPGPEPTPPPPPPSLDQCVPESDEFTCVRNNCQKRSGCNGSGTSCCCCDGLTCSGRGRTGTCVA